MITVMHILLLKELLLLKEQIIETSITNLVLKNNAQFTSFISKINGILIDNNEDLDVVTAMYNLIEYSRSYPKTSGSLWNY